MYCPKCGHQNDDGATNCVNCGAAIQDTAPAPPPPGQKVSSHLAPAILVTLFCCLPFGIVAIVYAAMTNGKLNAGDYAGAARASNRAKTWCWVAFACGIIIFVISILASISIPQFQAYRMRAMNSAAVADLRNAATAQDAYYADYYTYADSLEELGYSPSQGVYLEIVEVAEGGYYMVSSHEGSDTIYEIIGPGGEVTEYQEY